MVSITIDGSLVFQIVNFLLMIAVLNFLLYRPIRGILKQRKEKIEGFRSDVDKFAEQAREQAAKIESGLANARKIGFERKDGLKGQGLDEEKQMLEKAGREAAAAVQKIKVQVAGEIGVARDALKGELDVFSRDLAEKILGRSIK